MKILGNENITSEQVERLGPEIDSHMSTSISIAYIKNEAHHSNAWIKSYVESAWNCSHFHKRFIIVQLMSKIWILRLYLNFVLRAHGSFNLSGKLQNINIKCLVEVAANL